MNKKKKRTRVEAVEVNGKHFVVVRYNLPVMLFWRKEETRFLNVTLDHTYYSTMGNIINFCSFKDSQTAINSASLCNKLIELGCKPTWLR